MKKSNKINACEISTNGKGVILHLFYSATLKDFKKFIYPLKRPYQTAPSIKIFGVLVHYSELNNKNTFFYIIGSFHYVDAPIEFIL